MPSLCARRYGFALVVALSALLAASVAHVAIDLLGDVLLPHDAYDDLPHGTRGIVAALALTAAALLAIRSFVAALGAGSASRLRQVAELRRLVPRASAGYVALATGLSLAVLAGMEALDAAAAGMAIDDPADLLGGSISLGTAVLAVCTVAIALVVRAGLATIAGATLAIARAARALAIRPNAARTLCAGRRRAHPAAARDAIVACISKRGPPAHSSATA